MVYRRPVGLAVWVFFRLPLGLLDRQPEKPCRSGIHVRRFFKLVGAVGHKCPTYSLRQLVKHFHRRP